MPRSWTSEAVLALTDGYKPACVLAAAADLDLFAKLAGVPQTSGQLADALRADVRGLTILLDALVALGLLEKRDERYLVPPSVSELLTDVGARSVLAMVQHHASCMRRWVQLAEVVKSGLPAERRASVRGAQADEAAFIEAMNDISGPVADQLVADLLPLKFSHLLDVGGATGTWTIAWLRACPGTRATLFDLPHVIPMAERRLAEAGLLDRVALVAGDFYADPLPSGADLAWVSAIVHQNSRAQNRALFGAIGEVLHRDGRIVIRDILMDESRTRPAAGALFAVNMLVATEGGNSYTFAELREDLEAAGFADATVLRQDPEWMDSFVSARMIAKGSGS